MKFTYNWLKDFVEVNLAAKDLADKLTMAGIEVVSLEKKDSDWVFEVEITSNRADLLGVMGIAREVSAITNSKLKDLKFKIKNLKSKNLLEIKIQDIKDCPLYSARIIKEVKVGPSPTWLKKRLELVGCRSINNIVDITNYILFSLGQPLHAFDLDKIKDNLIFIRRAKEGEKIITIDGKEKNLNPKIIVIADREKPIAIAGIMGAKDSEVTQTTKNILLESAKFDPLLIRRARQSLGLSTESSYRFERDIDINNVKIASDWAVYLIEKIAKGSLVEEKTAGFFQKRRKIITFSFTKANKLLGTELKNKEMENILKRLSFKIEKKSKDKLEVLVPSFRKDINEEIDLIEEIARLEGYERIPLSFAPIKPQLESDFKQKVILEIKNILISQGGYEVINYSLIGSQDLASLNLESGSIIKIVNPLSNLYQFLRPTLLVGLLNNISKNILIREDICIFEIGKIFRENEELFLGIGMCGERTFLTEAGKIQVEFSIFHLKGILELILSRLGIKDFDFIQKDYPFFVKNKGMALEIGGENVGYLGEVSLDICNRFDIKNKAVFLAELNLEKLINFVNLKKRFVPLPLYPGVRRDISIAVREDIPIKEILKKIKEKKLPLLKELWIVDFYRGEKIPLGFKGITLGCLYLSQTHTLTDEEVNSSHNQLCEFLKEEFSAQIR